MRINNLFAVRKWLPTLRAMGPMLRELYQHPEKGFLGAEFFFCGRGPATVQYWRSFEDREKFARNPDDPHMPAWQRFNPTVGKDGSVGSSTRPSWSRLATSRRSTPTCPSLVSPRRPSTSGRSEAGRRRGDV